MAQKVIDIIVMRKGIDNQRNKWRLMSDRFFSKNSVYACARVRGVVMEGGGYRASFVPF